MKEKRKEDFRIIAEEHQRAVLIKDTARRTDMPVSWVSFKPRQQNTADWENGVSVKNIEDD